MQHDGAPVQMCIQSPAMCLRTAGLAIVIRENYDSYCAELSISWNMMSYQKQIMAQLLGHSHEQCSQDRIMKGLEFGLKLCIYLWKWRKMMRLVMTVQRTL